MKRHQITITVLICFMIASSAVAADPRAKLTRVAGNHQKYAATPRDALDGGLGGGDSPTMLAEIQAVMDSLRIAENALREEFGEEQGPALTRRLGALKRASRMRILHLQLKYARGEGRLELERRILTSIEDLQRPAAPGGPRLGGGISPPSVAKSTVKPAGGSPR